MYSLSPVLVLDTDGRHAYRVGREGHRVGLDRDSADVPEDTSEPGGGDSAVAQEVCVAGWPRGLTQPDPQQHPALEHEAIGVGRPPEPMEKPLEPISGQDGVRVDADRAGVVQEARQTDWARP